MYTPETKMLAMRDDDTIILQRENFDRYLIKIYLRHFDNIIIY